MSQVALLGDSIFDNRRYTGGGPDVAGHLRDLLPPGSSVALCAVDGDLISNVVTQVGGVPGHADHLFLSAGGNDLLQELALLTVPVGSMPEALARLRDAVAEFAASYELALQSLLALGRPVTVCTIYHGDLGEWLGPELAACVPVAAAPFNDVILRAALRHGLDAIDLREVCNEPGDFTNAIEPSAAGGRKIALAIVRSLSSGGSGPGRSTVTALPTADAGVSPSPV